MKEFIQNELKILENGCTDEEALKLQKVISKNVMDLYDVFENQHHTGFTSQYVLSLVDRLFRGIPVTALTGEDTEWEKLNFGMEPKYQNKRCSKVFKNSDGRAYIIDGKVFSDDNGHTWYTSSESAISITFPYDVPLTPEYVIINNKDERYNILQQLLQIVQDMNICILDDITNVTEDNIINTIIDDNNVDVYVQKVCEKYDINKNLDITKTTPMWILINNIMNELADKA